MAKRYSIMVTEYGSDREVELCQVEQNPDATVEGAKAKSLMIFNGKSSRRSRMPKYTNIRIVDNERGQQ